jgi:hypothetical protein
MKNIKNDNPKKFKEFFQELKRMSYVKECFHQDKNCSPGIIFAHSIQNNKILKKISHNGDVLYFDYYDEDNNLKFKLKRTGRKKATTFTGFCNHHDTSIFSSIENKDYKEGDKEQEFLFAYRALAKEHHAKRTSLELAKAAASIHPNSLGTVLLENYIRGINQSLLELENNKKLFNEALDNKKFDIIETRTIKFNGEYRVAVSSFFSPEKDFNGNTINVLSDFNKEVKNFCLTIFPQNNNAYILISYLKKDKKILYPILKQIEHNKNVKEKKIIISNIIGIYAENFAMSPIDWDKMPEQEQSEFLKLFFEETIFNDKNSLTQLKNLNLFVE